MTSARPPLVVTVLLRFAAGVLLLAAFQPGRPAAPIDDPGAGIALGAITGLALFGLLARRLPWGVRIPAARLAPVVAAGCILTLGALAEELVWRAVLLAALIPSIGAVAALVATSAGFALAHATSGRRAVATHLVTGSAFGGVFLATASFAAASLAHVTYNLGALLASESNSERAVSDGPRRA